MLFESAVANWSGDILSASEQFKLDYADVLGDTINETAEGIYDMVKAALSAYNSLSDIEKAKLVTEYANLKDNYVTLIVSRGEYETDFESGIDFWEQYDEFKDKNGAEVVQDSFDVEKLDNSKKGGISQDEAGNIFVANTNVTADTYAQVTESTYNPALTNSKIIDQNTMAINATMMLSPSQVIWNMAKKNNINFASADFDLYANITGTSSGVLVYYNYIDNNNFSFFSIRRGTGGLAVRNYSVTLDETVGLRTLTNRNVKAITFPLENWSTNNNNWVHVRLVYNEAGNAMLFVQGEDNDIIFTCTSEDVVEKTNRMFAIGSSYYTGNGTKVPVVIDNFSMILADSEKQKGIDFETKYADVFAMNATRFAPYDAKVVDAMLASYNDLSDTAKSVLRSKTNTAIDELKSIRARWNLTSDETIASSYRTIWGESEDVESAWNVYNRLSAQQKSQLTDIYDQLVDTLKTKAQVTDDAINVYCIGDSITEGTGATDKSTLSYPAQLDTLLKAKNANYSVRKFGWAGMAVQEWTNPNEIKLQFKENIAKTDWTDSHNGSADIVVIQLGTNDLRYVTGNNITENAPSLYKAAFEELVQSYLRLDNSPYVIISNTPVSYSAVESGYQRDAVAMINREIADKYGLPCVDMQAYTYAYSEEEISDYYSSDELHFTDRGYAEMAQVFCNAITSLTTVFDAENVTGFEFEESKINSFLTPVLEGATLKATGEWEKQNLGFNTSMPCAMRTGASIVEYGTIIAYYPSNAADKVTILDELIWRDEPTDKVVYARARYNSQNPVTSYTAGVGVSFNHDNIRNRFIARSYVQYDDGTVYYSVADGRNEEVTNSLKNASGVEGGYIVRSLYDVAKNMLIKLATLETPIVDTENIGTYDSETKKFTVVPAIQTDSKRLFEFIAENKDSLAL